MEKLKTYKTIEAKSIQEYDDKLNELSDKGYGVILSSVNFNDDTGKLDYFCATMQLDPQQQQVINADNSINRLVKSAVDETVKQLQIKQQDSE